MSAAPVAWDLSKRNVAGGSAGVAGLATVTDALLLLALAMTREGNLKAGREPDVTSEGEPAGFPEIALVDLPESLQEPLRALGEIVAGGARLVGARRRAGLPSGRLVQKLAALSRDLGTLSTLARQAAVAATDESPALRAAAFEVADRLAALAAGLSKPSGGEP